MMNLVIIVAVLAGWCWGRYQAAYEQYLRNLETDVHSSRTARYARQQVRWMWASLALSALVLLGMAMLMWQQWMLMDELRTK